MTYHCSCRETGKLIFACSGAADVGEVADRVARRLARIGIGKMNSLAGIASGDAGMLAEAKAARAMLVIDGCPSACATATLKQAGFKNFARIQLADLGLNKGESPASPENVERVVTAACTRFQ